MTELARKISFAQMRTNCASCSLRELCLPAGLSKDDIERIDSLINRNRRLLRGDSLFRGDDPLRFLYAVRTGFFKTSTSHNNHLQVTGFHLMGDVLGIDAIATGKHMCGAVALEDSNVCEIPFVELESLGRHVPGLQRHFHRVMSREIVRERSAIFLLGSMPVMQRLVAFLLDLSQRYGAYGYSSTHLNLRMARQDIASYLGVRIETISRALYQLMDENLLGIRKRQIEIKDPKRLRELYGKSNNR